MYAVHVDRHERSLLLGLAAVAAVLAIAQAALGLGGDVMLLVPLLVLLVPLLAGRFPGEQVISRLASGRRSPSRRLPLALPAPRRHAPAFARGGLLIARGLAVRPPPVAVLPHR